MRIKILLLFIIQVGSVYADYDLLLFEKKVHYIIDNYFYSWQMAKNEVNADSSVFINYYSPELVSGTEQMPTCVIDTGSGQFGRKVVKLKSGISYFVNGENKHIIFYTKANKDDKWTLYQIDNFNAIEATVTDVIYDTIEFLGVYDSIKIIRLKAIDRAGNQSVNLWNDSVIYLSKNYGIIRGFGMLSFPNKIIPLKLTGIESSDTMGVIPIEFKDVFDFQIGDEFHIFEGDTTWDEQGILTWRRIVVIDKYFIPNTNLINYEIEDKAMQFIFNPFFIDTVYSYNIAHYTINLDEYPNRLPEQRYKYRYRNYVDSILVSNRIFNNEYTGRQVIRPQQSYERFAGDCYVKLVNTEGFKYYTYIQGCGDFFEQNWDYRQKWKRLIYFKKGEEEWGSPLDFVLSASELNHGANLNLLSNALRLDEAIGVFSVCHQEVFLNLYDLHGKIVYSTLTYLDEGVNLVPMVTQGTGVYVIELKVGLTALRKRLLIFP